MSFGPGEAGGAEGPSIRALAPAKINLVLEVLGTRSDGYHDIRTWMLAVDLEDEVRARATDDGRIRFSLEGSFASPDVPTNATNLAVRAAESCLSEARRRGLVGAHVGLDLRLQKRIPSQSGLGGASSDAAAAWIATRACLGIALPDKVGWSCLERLGSDCVFFLKSCETGFAYCEGRGERVTVAPALGPLSIAIVTPALSCPTARVYGAFAMRSRAVREPNSTWNGTWTSVGELRNRLRNDLEPAAGDVVPELSGWRELLDACAADHFRLSGSGSSFFGLFDEDRAAQDVLARIEKEAHARALGLRLACVAHPAGHGSRLALDN